MRSVDINNPPSIFKDITVEIEEMKKGCEEGKNSFIMKFPDVTKNQDLKFFGHHRDINLKLSPFMLDNPYLVFKDKFLVNSCEIN